jgi:hypothetical protein
MLKLISFFLSPLGRLLGGIALITGLIAGFARSQQQQGAVKAVAQIQRSNENAVKKATAAGARARDGRVRGARDPYTLD